MLTILSRFCSALIILRPERRRNPWGDSVAVEPVRATAGTARSAEATEAE